MGPGGLVSPLADLRHFRLTKGGSQKLTAPSKLERHLHFASIRLCPALLFIISIVLLKFVINHQFGTLIPQCTVSGSEYSFVEKTQFFPETDKTIGSALKSYNRKYHQISGK